MGMGSMSPGFWTVRRLCLLCLGLGLMLSGVPTWGQDVQTFEPEIGAPVDALPEVDLPDPLPNEVPEEEAPEVFALSGQELSEAQDMALADPNAEPPDVVLALDPRQGSAAPTVSFSGLDYASGGQKTPPDASIARSPDRVLEAVNAALRLFDTNGAVRATRFTATFFGISESIGVFDP